MKKVRQVSRKKLRKFVSFGVIACGVVGLGATAVAACSELGDNSNINAQNWLNPDHIKRLKDANGVTTHVELAGVDALFGADYQFSVNNGPWTRDLPKDLAPNTPVLAMLVAQDGFTITNNEPYVVRQQVVTLHASDYLVASNFAFTGANGFGTMLYKGVTPLPPTGVVFEVRVNDNPRVVINNQLDNLSNGDVLIVSMAITDTTAYNLEQNTALALIVHGLTETKIVNAALWVNSQHIHKNIVDANTKSIEVQDVQDLTGKAHYLYSFNGGTAVTTPPLLHSGEFVLISLEGENGYVITNIPPYTIYYANVVIHVSAVLNADYFQFSGADGFGTIAYNPPEALPPLSAKIAVSRHGSALQDYDVITDLKNGDVLDFKLVLIDPTIYELDEANFTLTLTVSNLTATTT